MKKVNIKPFDEFWLSCTFNNTFSILTSLNESYKDLAYLNCYMYHAYNPWAPKHIYLNVDDILQHKFVKNAINYKYFYMNHSDNYIDCIKEILNKNNILIYVELFDWLPNSPSWHKVHHRHCSLLIGYDNKKNAFMVIDDDNSGYGIRYVSVERFSKCVIDESGNITGYIVETKESEKYNLCLNDVIFYAKKINENLINFVGGNDFWVWKRPKQGERIYEYYAFEVFKVENRHTANICLVERMYEKNFISSTQYEKYVKIFKDIKEGWRKIKFILLKLHYCSYSGTEKEKVKEINLLKDNLIEKEQEVWERIIKIGIMNIK